MKGKPLGRGQAQKAPELIVFGNLKLQQLLCPGQRESLCYLRGQSLTLSPLRGTPPLGWVLCQPLLVSEQAHEFIFMTLCFGGKRIGR